MQRLDPRARILVGSFIAVFALAMVVSVRPNLAEEDLFHGDSAAASYFLCTRSKRREKCLGCGP